MSFYRYFHVLLLILLNVGFLMHLLVESMLLVESLWGRETRKRSRVRKRNQGSAVQQEAVVPDDSLEAEDEAEDEALEHAVEPLQEGVPELDNVARNFAVPAEQDEAVPLPRKESAWKQEDTIFQEGRLRRDAVMDLLMEQACAHNLSRKCMDGFIDIINLIVLDAGADAPILPKWAAFDKRVTRAGKEVTRYYFVCPWECDTGCIPIDKPGEVPNFCSGCGAAVELSKEEAKQFTLRHFDMGVMLREILKHPGN